MNGYRSYMVVAITAVLGVVGWVLVKIADTHDTVLMLHEDFVLVESNIARDEKSIEDHEARLRRLETQR